MTERDYVASLRRTVGTARILTPSTACVLVRKDGRILFQQRAESGAWGCPGGMLNLGETVIDGLRREVREETGLSTRNEQLIGVYSGRDYFGTYPDGNRIASLLLAFYTHDFDGEIVQSAESSALRFEYPHELPGLMAAHHRQYLDDYRDHVLAKLEIPVIR